MNHPPSHTAIEVATQWWHTLQLYWNRWNAVL